LRSGEPLKEVLKLLPKLNASELEIVRVRVAFLAGTASTPNKENDWLLEGVTEELRRRGLWMRRYAVPAKLLPSGYQEKSRVVREHLLKGLGSRKLRPVDGLLLGRTAASVLADYLIHAKVPISPKTVLNNLDKIPVALEAAFPGYWASGMLGFCFQARE
jgi:hypothetical protein